jgi:NADPH2:quinone reductase
MKAAIITQPGAADVLKILERPIPEFAEDEILIKVYAAGINRPDIFQRKGNYPPPLGASKDILGLEVAGEIAAIGDKVTKWNIGDKVCSLINGGGYAQYAVAHQDVCLFIPKGLSFIEAASLPETIFTVWNNVFKLGNLKNEESFLVHGGTSGIGITAIQIAKAMGSKVFATAGSKEKCEACIHLGADLAINYKDQDFEEILSKYGVDVILDMIGGDYQPKNINILNPNGRLVYINAIKGKNAQLDILKVMSKQLTITGSTLRPQSNHFKATLAKEIKEKIWPLIENGLFKPIIYKSFDLENVVEAHLLMESNQHIGKLVLKFNS